MRCREAEKWVIRSMDGTLSSDRQSALDEHLDRCPNCRKARQEYASTIAALRGQPAAEPLPYFWNRLESRIKERERLEPWTVWTKWSLRAIPVALLLIGFFVGAIAFQPPVSDEEMSQPAALLLRNANPLSETSTFFDEEKSENKNMMIIFAGDERLPGRRYLP
jgi:anti-sigma factor RsiW